MNLSTSFDSFWPVQMVGEYARRNVSVLWRTCGFEDMFDTADARSELIKRCTRLWVKLLN